MISTHIKFIINAYLNNLKCDQNVKKGIFLTNNKGNLLNLIYN